MEKKLALLHVVVQLIGLALVVFVVSVAIVGCGLKEEEAPDSIPVPAQTVSMASGERGG